MNALNDVWSDTKKYKKINKLKNMLPVVMVINW